MGIADRVVAAAAQRSWAVYQRVSCRTTRTVGGRTVQIPLRVGLGLANLRHDTAELGRVLRVCARRGAPGYFVDIGANVGQSLLALLATDLPASYIGFEPDVEAAAYVVEFIRANALANATVLPVALGRAHGVAVMRSAERAWSGSSLDRSITLDQMYHHEARVPLSTGDVHLAHIPDDGFLLIKIDVEGYELEVLNGLEQTVLRARPPLYVEVLGYDHFRDGSYGRDFFGELTAAQINQLVEARTANGAAVEHWLRERGYELFFPDGEGMVPIQRLDLGSSIPGAQGIRNVLALSVDWLHGR